MVVADINLAAAQDTVAHLPGHGHLALQCDVASSASVRQAIEATLESCDRLDAIHNNAAVSGPSKPLHETTDEQWEQVFAVNLKSIYYTMLHGFEALKASRGCVLNTASMVGLLGQDHHAAYVATKGGLIALTKAMALDYAP